MEPESKDRPKRSRSVEHSNYEYLSLEGSQDKNLILRSQIIKAAHTKIKGETLKIVSQKDKFIDKESQNIIKLAKQLDPADATFESVIEDWNNMKQYSQVKMAMFDFQFSGSSQQEIDPCYQSADDVIVIASGAPEILQFYLVGKIQTPQNIRIQPIIKPIQALNKAQTPIISIAQRIGAYTIYKLTVSSLIRKYMVVAQTDSCKLSSQQIKFQNKTNSKLLLNRGFNFNFTDKKMTKLGILDQILIFSLYEPTQTQHLLNTMTKISVQNKYQMKISQQLEESICKITPKHYLYHILMQFTDSWRPQTKKVSQEQLKIYKLIAKAFLTQSQTLVQNMDAYIRTPLAINLSTIVIQSQINLNFNILTQKQRRLIIQKIFKQIKQVCDFQTIFNILQQFYISQCKILCETISIDDFLQKYIRTISIDSTVGQILAGQIYTACYYSNIYFNKNQVQKSMIIILNSITPTSQKIQLDKQKYLIISIYSLVDILIDPKKFNIKQLDNQYIYKLLKLYPLLRTFSHFDNVFDKNIDRQILHYINKQMFKFKKNTKKILQYIILIVKQFYLNQDIVYYFLQNDEIGQNFSAKLEQIINYANKLQDQKQKNTIFKKINSELIITAIKKNINIKDIKKVYRQALQKKERKQLFRIIDTGLNEQFFEQQKNQLQFDEILKPIIDYHYRSHNIFRENWSMGLKFCYHINQKILQKVIQNGSKQLDNLDKPSFYEQLKKTVEYQAKQQQKQRLKIIILQYNLQISKENIKEYLMEKEKLYLKILVNIIKKKQSRKQQVILAISAISNEIQNNQLTYNQIVKMIPTSQKDQQKFVQLFTQKILDNMIQIQKKTKLKIDHLIKVKKMINVIKNKFSVPIAEIETLIKLIDISKQSLETCKITQQRKIETYQNFSDHMLNLYQYQFFFKNFDSKLNSIDTIMQKAGEQLDIVSSRIRKILKDLQRQEVCYDEYSFFDFDKLTQKQLKELFKALKIKQSQQFQIVKIVQFHKKIYLYTQICQNLEILIQNDKQLSAKLKQNITQILKFGIKIKNDTKNLKVQCSQYQSKINLMKQILSKISLKLPEVQEEQLLKYMPLDNLFSNLQIIKDWQKNKKSISSLLTLMIISRRMLTLQKLSKYKDSIQYIRESILDNNIPNITIDPQDFQNYNQIIQFYEKSIIPNLNQTGSVLKLIQLIKTVKGYKIQNQQSFNYKLINLTDKANQFQTCFLMLKNPAYMQTANIKKIVDNSRIVLYLNTQNHSYKMNIQVNIKQNDFIPILFNDLDKYKDQAYIIKSKASQYQNQQEKQQIIYKVQTFLKIYDVLHSINSKLQQLFSLGFIIFEDQEIVMKIKQGNYEDLNKFLEEKSKLLEKWNQLLKQIYSFSNKATMLRGAKLKQFYQVLVESNCPINNRLNFRNIASIQLIQQFIKKLSANKKIKKQNIKSSLECLEIIRQFFSFYKTQVQKKQKPAPDRDQQYIQIIRFQEQDRDFLSCLNEMKLQKLDRINQSQMMACNRDTTKQDIQSFIERTIRDPDNQYVMMGYDKLSLDLQKKAIQLMQQSRKNNNNKSKLILAGREATHLIYRYMNQKLNVIKKYQGGALKQQSAQYRQFIDKSLNKNQLYGIVRIYTSSYPGLGKTHTIQNLILKQKKKPIFFPISGRTTSQNLYNRLNNNIKAMGNQKYDILIQLYEIQKNDIDIVNNFLRQVVIFRSYCHKAQFCCLNTKCRVFIQIQDQKITKYIPFIKYIIKYNIQININKFDLQKIQYKIEDKKLCYILQHLDIYQGNQLDSIDLPHKDGYKPTKIVGNSLQLLKKYFVQPFSKLSQPTFYQFKYWVDLFYQSCSSFTGSYQISHKFFITDYGQANIKKYKIQHIRSDFFKVLLDNSIHFLVFSIENLLQTDFSKDQDFEHKNRKNLNKIPFFLVPNNQCQWFSFIYRTFDQVPQTIRSYLISQALVIQAKQHKNKTPAQMGQIIGKRYELIDLQKQKRQQFQSRLQSVLRDISGTNSYKLSDDPGYVLNLDNFIKICLISYKMKVNIPLLIQGEAGVGKTALLRHLVQEVFKYQFIPHTINAGVTEQILLKKIQQAKTALQNISILNQDKFFKKKVCIFFDQFNTLPQLGYIKQLMMENRFMGHQMSFFKNLIVFAACNPYRNRQSIIKNQKKEQKQQHLAFTVKRPPLSMGQIIWNFGHLSYEQMKKYIIKMLSEFQIDHKSPAFIQMICQIQNKLNQIDFGSTSLRDVQRFRQIYTWLKTNLPDQSKIQLKNVIKNHYDNKPLRAFIIALNLTYFTRLNTKVKVDAISKIVDERSSIKYQIMFQFKKFQQQDFASRLKINYEGISLNSALKQNLFTIFICLMKCLPILIVGSPGCSKSLATRIISDNFKDGIQLSKDYDAWLRQFPRIVQFFFQGSQSCTTISVQNRFKSCQAFAYTNIKNMKKPTDRKIPLIIFDQMGLAEKSPDNPLKAIHEPLQLTPHKKKQIGLKNNRQIAFLGISNTQLDMSKMSRFLVLRRSQMSLDDLKKTAKEISKGVFGKQNFNHSNIQSYLEYFSQTYDQFLNLWRQTEGKKSQTHRYFFGLRDFYNLVRTFSDLLKLQQDKTKLEKVDQICDLAIYRNFNGLSNSYEHFKDIFFNQKLKKNAPKLQHNVLKQILSSFKTKSRRFPLVIVQDDISQSIFCQSAIDQFDKIVIVSGSPFLQDLNNSEYVIKIITQIIKIVASQKKLISISLNKSIQGALFDLFNKFFFKRDGADMYRVSMESGLMMTLSVNPKFNASVMISSQNLRNQSPAFLNRFQKYNLDIDTIKNTKIDKLMTKINNILNSIQKICVAEELGHYKCQNLFFNYTPKSIKSLIYETYSENKHMDQDQLLSMCLRTLAKVASKDFQYILDLIINKKQEYQNQHVKSFIQGIKQKSEFLKKSQTAIIITSDSDIWKTDNGKDKIINLLQYKNEKDLKQSIQQYMLDRKDIKQSTLFIDFSRQSEEFGGNLNDSKAYLKQNQTRIEVQYIINLIKKCKQSLLHEKKQILNQRIRLILNYNRRKKELFTELSFMSGYPIFSLDGSNNTSNKQTIFETVNMKNVIQKCLKCFKFSLQEAEDNQALTVYFNEVINQFAKYSGIFSDCCKDSLLLLEADSIQINEQQIISSLKNKENVKKYNSISLALTKQYFEKKFTSPIIMLIITLAKNQLLLNYTQQSKHILSKINDQTREREQNYEQKNSENMKKFMTAMAKLKIEKIKSSYKQKKNQSNFPSQLKPQQLKVNLPTYFPYSSLQTNLLFSSQILQKIQRISKQFENINKQFSQLEQQYNTKLQQAFLKPQLFTLYRNLTRSENKYWKRMLMADVTVILAQKAKVPSTYIFYFINQIQILLKQYQNSFLMKMVIILGQFDIWSSAFRIWNALIHNGIDKNMNQRGQFNLDSFGHALLKHSKNLLTLNQQSLIGLKGETIQQKLMIFTQIHHSVHFQIQNLLATKMIQQNAQQYTEMTITQQFLTIWQTIHKQIQDAEISKMLKQLTRQKTTFTRISVIANFFQQILGRNLQTQKIIYQYLANKLFPKWFKYCRNQKQVQDVFKKFNGLCQKNMSFAHNSIGSIEIGLSSIKINYQFEDFYRNFEVLKNIHIQNNTNLKISILLWMGKQCESKNYQSNLSILMCNILYMLIIRNNQVQQFKLQDLQKNLDNFKKCVTQINQGNNPILKLLSFAFLKRYLQYYIQLGKPENLTCMEIDKILCENNQITTDLRFYCLRLLRTKLNPKQISQQYIKIGTYKWCQLFKQQMKQQQSRSIQVPKVPQNMIIKQLQDKIEQYKKFQGRDVTLLDQIINLGKANVEGRYNVLNFFAKYIYSMAYNKTYKQSIINHIKSKQVQYTQKMGREQYKLILKYCQSKFDDNYFVQKHETFTQMHFIIINNINWLLASKSSKSPVHSLFFTNGALNDSIQRQISLSFLPCGPQNPYISIAKVIYGDTRNNNIGIYICSNQCDYMYSHLNCGWPNEARPCIMCGQNIGSGGGHKLAKAEKGARRIMSQKFIDNSSFYIGQFLKLQEFWDAQRCYIQAQINRMRIKSQVTLKPQIKKERKIQKQNLLGYNMTITNNRVSTIASKVIMLCLQSNLYTFVSMDLIKQEQYMKLFETNEKNKILQKLNKNIQGLIKDIKEVVNLNTKFYTWIFGIQAQIYKLLINFHIEFNNYVAKLDKQSVEVAKKLKDKIPSLNNTAHKQLYTDLARVIQNGLISKQFKQILEQNLMNSRNQFTRQVFEEKVQQIISSNFFQGKLAFVQSRYQSQGKMQFPFESMLTQSKQDIKKYKYCHILKIPSQSLTFDQIANKYQIIIRDRYPVLDYLLKNSILFKLLTAFKNVIQASNLLGKNVDKKFTRFSCKNLQLSQFNKKYCNSQIDLAQFFSGWLRISKDLGSVQVGCKIYGTMNDQLNASSDIYNFLLDDILKFNACGKLIAGIFHNFALTHNQTINILKSRKNLISKYKKMNFFVENYRKNPQNITQQDCINIKQQEIMKKILQASVPSIKYGQNLVYHNFDFCEAYFLKNLKGKCQLQPQIQKYISVQFVGQMFSKGAVNTNSTAIGDVRDVQHQQLTSQNIQSIKQWYENKNELQALQLFGELQKLINKISLNAKIMLLNRKQQFRSFINSKCSDLNITILRGQQPFSQLQISQIIPLYILSQEILRPKLQKTIPQIYTKPLKPQQIQKLKQLLLSMPKQQSDFSPTPKQFLIAIQNFTYRNLLPQFYPQQSKIFQFVLYKEDYWPLGYDIYTKNGNLFSSDILKQLQVKNCYQVMKLVEGFVKI